MRLGAEEGRSSVEHDEEDNTCSEDVSLNPCIVPLLHLWRLVPLGSHSRGQFEVSEVALGIARQAEVRNFQLEIMIEEDVLGFEIPVRNTHLSEVFDGCNQLLDVGAADLGSEPTEFGEVVEKLTSFGQFENDQGALFFRAGTDPDLRLAAMVDHVDQVGEVEF